MLAKICWWIAKASKLSRGKEHSSCSSSTRLFSSLSSSSFFLKIGISLPGYFFNVSAISALISRGLHLGLHWLIPGQVRFLQWKQSNSPSVNQNLFSLRQMWVSFVPLTQVECIQRAYISRLRESSKSVLGMATISVENAVVKGHHVYFSDVRVVDIFNCFPEIDSLHDPYAVVVINLGIVVRHLPTGFAEHI